MDRHSTPRHATSSGVNTTRTNTDDAIPEPSLPDPIIRNQRERRLAWLLFGALVALSLVTGQVIS